MKYSFPPGGCVLNQQKSSFGVQLCSDVCPRTLSEFREKKNCGLRGIIDNVKGQISFFILQIILAVHGVF